MTAKGKYGMPGRRGPYGTNEGDMWLGTGSPVQARLDKEKSGQVLIFEMMVKDGKLQECLYVTELPELIERATKGHERYMAQRASQN